MDLRTIDSKIHSEDSSLRREAATLLAEIGGENALTRLETLLKDPNNGVRDAAQNSIILLGGRDAIKKMVLLITHEDPAIRNMAIDILRKIGEDGLDILHNLAKDPNDNVRLFVLDILGSIGSRESLDILIQGLYDSNPNVRNAAVISLGELGDPSSFSHLKQLINDEEWIRFSVIETLAKIPLEEIVDFLLHELKRWSNDEITMCAILATLGEIGSYKTIQPLIDMLEDANEYVECSIIQTLLKIIPADSIASLKEKDKTLIKGILEAHLLEADDDFARSILDALSRIGDKHSAESIISLAKKVDPDSQMEKWEEIREALTRLSDPVLMVELLDQDERCQILASQILGQIGTEHDALEIAGRVFSATGYVKRTMTDTIAAIGGPSIRETLLKLIHDQDGHVISSGLRALGRIGIPDDIPEVEVFLRYPYPDVRFNALEAIAQIGGKIAEETLVTLLKDTDPQVRTMALNGLQKMKSPRLYDSLNQMLSDPEGEVRMSAAQIIRDDMIPVEKDILMVLLQDELNEIRHIAIDIIGQNKVDNLRSFLENAVVSPDMWTAYHAIEALGKFKDEDAKTMLLHIMKSGPDILRIPAVKALGQWEDESLADDLEVYMDDENLDVVRAVSEAIDRLQGVVF